MTIGTGIRQYLAKAGTAGALAFAMATSVLAEDLTLKFAGNLPVDHQGTKVMYQIAEEIEAADVGLKVTVFPANQLGSGEELLEDTIRGNVDLMMGFIYAHKDPAFEINSMPYLVSTWEDMDNTVRNKDSAFFEVMSEHMDALGLVLFNNNPEGFASVVANVKPEDWSGLGSKGMNIRVWSSDVVNNTMQSLGYNTTTMAWADIFAALQSGIVDGAICCTKQATYTIFAQSNVGKYYVSYNAFMEISSFYGSKKTWEKMNDEQRTVVQAAFDRASDEFFEWNKANDASFEAKLIESGYEVLNPSEEELAQLRDHVRETIWPDIADIVGVDVLERIKADLN